MKRSHITLCAGNELPLPFEERRESHSQCVTPHVCRSFIPLPPLAFYAELMALALLVHLTALALFQIGFLAIWPFLFLSSTSKTISPFQPPTPFPNRLPSLLFFQLSINHHHHCRPSPLHNYHPHHISHWGKAGKFCVLFQKVGKKRRRTRGGRREGHIQPTNGPVGKPINKENQMPFDKDHGQSAIFGKICGQLCSILIFSHQNGTHQRHNKWCRAVDVLHCHHLASLLCRYLLPSPLHQFLSPPL